MNNTIESNRNVLIIEKNLEILILLEEMFKDLGFRVKSFNNFKDYVHHELNNKCNLKFSFVVIDLDHLIFTFLKLYQYFLRKGITKENLIVLYTPLENENFRLAYDLEVQIIEKPEIVTKIIKIIKIREISSEKFI